MSKYENDFEIIARAVIVHDGKILLCRGKGKDYYFFPGGHVERGEKSEVALLRELDEEVGAEAKTVSFIGSVENIFADTYQHHEINLVFEVEVSASGFKSREDHLEFEMVPVSEFQNAKVLPRSLKSAVQKWMEDKKIFWNSER